MNMRNVVHVILTLANMGGKKKEVYVFDKDIFLVTFTSIHFQLILLWLCNI